MASSGKPTRPPMRRTPEEAFTTFEAERRLSCEDHQRQSEEIEVLQSIYDTDLVVLQPLVPAEESSQLPFTCELKVNIGSGIECTIRLPFDYPSSAHPTCTIEFLPDDSEPSSLPPPPSYAAVIERMYTDVPCVDEVVVYEYLDYLKLHVQEVEVERRRLWREEERVRKIRLDQEEHASLLAAEALMAADGIDSESSQRVASFDGDDAPGGQTNSRFGACSVMPPTIYTGEPFTDRKSTFQAHVATVNSVEDTRAMLAELYSHNKIARATHNMYAYVLKDPSTGILRRENDDDGEDQAGSRLAHLLQVMQLTNVMVVVSRWYGGILLGADRFKHINNLARQSLEAHAVRINEAAAAAAPQKKSAKSSQHSHKR